MLMMLFALIAAQSPDLPKKIPASICERSAAAAPSAARARKGSSPIIQESLYNGRFIRLSDSSLWEINPKDTPITQSWITPVEILVNPSDDESYPFRLTNSLTGSSVLARRATSTLKTTPKTTPSTQK